MPSARHGVNHHSVYGETVVALESCHLQLLLAYVVEKRRNHLHGLCLGTFEAPAVGYSIERIRQRLSEIVERQFAAVAEHVGHSAVVALYDLA